MIICVSTLSKIKKYNPFTFCLQYLFAGLLLIMLILIFIPFQLKGQQYRMKNYTAAQVGHSKVHTLLEDHQGYIWIGTWGGGLSRFDGNTFEHFSKKNGLEAIYVNAMYQDKEKNIWIGTRTGLYHFNGHTFKKIFADSFSQQINSIICNSSDNCWLGSENGLYQFHLSRDTILISIAEVPQGTKVYSCFIDNQNKLWIGTEKGVYYLSGDQWRHFNVEEEQLDNRVISITQDENGTIWLATPDRGIWLFGNNEISRFSHSDELEEGLGIQTLYSDSVGHIWVGMANQGAFQWNPMTQQFSKVSEKVFDGLESDHVKTILHDSWGNYWLGTSGGGLSKFYYTEQQFVHYSEKDGLADKEVYAMCKDTSGSLWLATSRGIVQFNGQHFSNYSKDLGVLDITCKAIYQDTMGRLWIGTEGKGLALYADNSIRYFRSFDGLGGDLIQDIVQDSSGRIWVAMADAGIACLEMRFKDSLNTSFRIHQFGKSDGLPGHFIYDLHIDKMQRVWFAGSRGGIGYIEKDSIIVSLNRSHGLPSNEVRTLTEDHLGNLWGGTSQNGIFKLPIYLDTFQVQQFPDAALFSNNIYSLIFDHDNYLWVGHHLGVDRLKLNQSHNEIIEHSAYHTGNGFSGGEVSESAVLCDSSGAVWFGTIDGLMRYQARSVVKNRIPPKLHFTNIRLAYDSLKNTPFRDFINNWGGLKEGLVLPYYKNQLGFEFSGINHARPDKVFYSWILDGLDEEWSPPQDLNQVNYPNLLPGKYTFKVKSYNENGFGNTEPLSISFEINPPFWQSWWFRITALGIALLLITLFFRYRISVIKRKAQAKAERLELEKTLITLEQKALQLQMNPHFIFNALNTIQGLINEKDHRTARYQLAKFSKLMRTTLENSRHQHITLEQEIEALENYLSVEQLSRGNTFDFTVETVGDTDPEQLKIPPMIIQPFVENAIVHGVANITHHGLIEVYFTRRRGFLECTISDNGIGREKAGALKSQLAHQHKSTALEVTQERLDLLNKNPNLKSLEIMDILGEENKIEGTKVILRIPL